MNKSRTQSADKAVNSEAINRVLQAEQAAQQAVEQCERQAQEILQAAQMRAQRINQHADERIAWVEMRCAQWLAEQSRQLAMADRAQPDAGGVMQGRDLTGLVDALAARLTGADKEAP